MTVHWLGVLTSFCFTLYVVGENFYDKKLPQF